ncbi:MAG: hypothetical protein KDK78_00665, partial [Chlamydiia bacterium]|nr:hypothetical protein [Chlamydiia bacterium]
DLFASLYIERLLEAQSGNFYLSPSLRTPEMKNWLLKVLVNSGKRLLGQKAVYDASERRKVAEEFHQHLARRMVEFQSAIANPAALFILPSEDEVHALASHATHSDLEWAAHCSQKVLAYAPDLQQWASEMLLTELQSASDAEESPYEHRKIALKSLLKAASERLREEGASKGCIVLSAFDPAIAEDSGLFEDKCRSRLFIQTFLHQCFEAKKSGFHFPKRLRTPKFRADVKRIMDEVWADVFCQSTHLSVGEKKDFIEIVYVRLMRHIIEVLEPDSYNASCKDCIDRGAGANSLFFWFQRYLEGLDDSKEAQDDLIVMTLAPALLVRQRHIYHHRLARMTDAMKRLQGSGVRERILARLAHSKIRGIEIQRQKGQGLRSKCTEANSFVEYRKAISADATFDRSKRWSKLVQEILADEQMQEKTHMLRGADGEPQKLIPGQFARDVPRQLITINGQSFNDVPGIEGKIQAAYAALCTAAGHNEMKIDTLARVGTQSIVNALFERLNSRFTNTNIHIQLRQASEDLPQPSIVNYVVSESQAQLHAQTLYKIDCVDPESADAAKIAGRAFIPIYLRGELSIDLDRPTHTSYRYSLVSDEQLKELKKAGLVAGASDDLEEDWVMTKSEDKAL